MVSFHTHPKHIYQRCISTHIYSTHRIPMVLYHIHLSTRHIPMPSYHTHPYQPPCQSRWSCHCLLHVFLLSNQLERLVCWSNTYPILSHTSTAHTIYQWYHITHIYRNATQYMINGILSHTSIAHTTGRSMVCVHPPNIQTHIRLDWL